MPAVRSESALQEETQIHSSTTGARLFESSRYLHSVSTTNPNSKKHKPNLTTLSSCAAWNDVQLNEWLLTYRHGLGMYFHWLFIQQCFVSENTCMLKINAFESHCNVEEDLTVVSSWSKDSFRKFYNYVYRNGGISFVPWERLHEIFKKSTRHYYWDFSENSLFSRDFSRIFIE